MAIRENYLKIKENIAEACRRAKRDPETVQVLAVCKEQAEDQVSRAIECGIRLFGENRVQEAELHINRFRDAGLNWHFIGRLQKNKINRILNLFQLIESVDGVKNLEHIQKRTDSPLAVFLEVNVGNEPSKAGFTIEGLKKALPYIANLRNIKITGLLAIPPFFDNPEKARPFFRKLRELGAEINRAELANINIENLSMGMSADYEVAVEEGATIVRLGTALFGRRRP